MKIKINKHKDEMVFENTFEAGAWVSKNGTSTGEYKMETKGEGVTRYEEEFNIGLSNSRTVWVSWMFQGDEQMDCREDLPFDNGSATLLVDGCSVVLIK